MKPQLFNSSGRGYAEQRLLSNPLAKVTFDTIEFRDLSNWHIPIFIVCYLACQGANYVVRSSVYFLCA